MSDDTFDRGIKYTALPSQQKFHNSTARFKGFSGPIGSGKSAALCHEAIRLSYLNPGRTGLIGSPTYPMLRDSTLTALIETLNDNAIPFELEQSGNVLVMTGHGVADPTAGRGRVRKVAGHEPRVVRAG